MEMKHYNLDLSISEIAFRLPNKDKIFVYSYSPNLFQYVKNGNVYYIKKESNHLKSNDSNYLSQINLNKNYSDFFKIINEEPFFNKLYKNIGFISFPKTTSYFEIFVRAIIEQQISYRVAVTLQNRLIENYGNKIKLDNIIYFSFPTPETLINSDLRKIGISERKEEYIKNICHLLLNKELNLDELENLDRSEIYEILLPIKGIGPWSIEHIMLRGYGRYDFLPFNDLFFKNLCKLYNIPDLEKYENWKGLLGYYLVVYHNWVKI